jgi:RimJ/RimL family protein N-acetyltransferase
VKLREFMPSDLPTVFAYACLDEEMKYMTFPRALVPEDSLEFLTKVIEHQQAEPRLEYGMALEIDGRHVGSVGIRVSPNRPTDAELGYILHPDYWGQGYMVEACRLMIDFAFKELGVHRVAAYHDPDNIQSRRVMEKLGMEYEGHIPSHLKGRDGTWRPSDQRGVVNPA